MRQLAADAGAVETVMFRDGCLTEASASNVLVVDRRHDRRAAEGQPDPARHHLRRDARIRARRRLPLEVRPVPKAEALARRRDVAVVVDQGSARGDDARRQAVRRRRARPGVPPDVRDCSSSKAKARRLAVTAPRVSLDSTCRERVASSRSGRDGTRARRRCARSQCIDLADEQRVVAGAMLRVVAAFEPRDAAVDQRRAGERRGGYGTPAKRSACGREKRRASSTWSCASTLTT